MGACRREELMKVEVSHLEDLNTAYLVRIPDTKTKTERQFVITGNLYNICKKYRSLRPINLPNNLTRFFLNYQNGKCTKQPVGINKFGALAREVATFLKLPNAACYTGHCLRRSSATILVDAGADITALKRHGGWQSTAVAEGYLDHSLNNKMDTANKILHSVENADDIRFKTHTHEEQSQSKNKVVTTEGLAHFDEPVESPANSYFASNANYLTSTETQLDARNLTRYVSFANCENISNLTFNIYLPK